jgi:hypothetical protein
MKRFVEAVYPYVAAALAAWLFYRSGVKFPNSHEIFTGSITIGAVFVGFLATAEAIVVSLQGPRAEQFRGSRFFALLLRYTQESIWISILYCSTSLVGYFYEPGHLPRWYGVTWIFLTIAALFAFQRISRILIGLVKNVNP